MSAAAARTRKSVYFRGRSSTGEELQYSIKTFKIHSSGDGPDIAQNMSDVETVDNDQRRATWPGIFSERPSFGSHPTTLMVSLI